MSKEENKAEGAHKFRKNISETGRAVVASKFPVAVRPSGGLVNSWTSIIVEEEDGEEEIPNVKGDQTYLHASSGAFDWEVFLHEFLTLPSNAYWRAVVVISIVINFFLVTFAYSFCKEILIKSYHELTITDVIYGIDFTLALLHKYRRSLRLRMKVEFRSRFALLVDAISLLPLGMFYYIIYREEADNNVLFVFKSVKFLRFYRVYLYLDNITDSAGKNQWMLFSVKYLLYLSLLFHSLACFWFTLGCTSEKECQGKLTWTVTLETYTWKPDSVWDWYLISSYYSLCTIANTGFGEIHSTTTEERVLSIIAMLLGFYLTIGMFIGSLTSQVVNKERRQTMYVNQLHNIRKYLLNSKCDAVLSKRILTYYEVFWEKKNGVKEASNFDLLPLPLKMEICYDINCGLLDCSILLANLGEPFLRRLSLQMKNEFYLPGDVIYYQNVAKYTMIVIVSGVIEILSDEDDESPMVSFTSGTCLGEISTVLTCPAKATVRAATYTELQVIKKTDFFRLMIDYPLIHQKVRQNIAQRIDAAYKKKATTDETQVAFSLMVSHSKEYRSIKSLKKALRMNQGLKSQRNQFDLDGGTSTTDMFTRDFLSLYNISEKVIERKGGMCWSNSFPCILQPNSAFLKVWMHVLFILMVYVGFVYPYCGGFIRTFPEWAGSIGIIIDSVFFVDIVITCVTAIEHKNRVDVKLKEIMRQRMNTVGFYCDIISILPFEVYSLLEENPYKSERLWAVLKMNRLFKCWKISQYFKTLESNLWASLNLLRTFKYVLYLILVSFWAGVALYMEACFNIECDEESWFAIQIDYEVRSKDLTPCTQYPYDMSVYFAVMTLSGVGFGDIYPQSKKDIIFTMFNIICGILFFGYCIAEFSATFTLSSRPRVEFEEAVIAIHKFMRDNNMSPGIVERVNNYFNLQWMHNEGIVIRQKRPLLADANLKLQQEVLTKERVGILSKVPLFQFTDMDFLQLLAADAHVKILPPNEVITYAGSITREMYIVQEGYCEIYDSNTQQIKQAGPGSHCGDVEMLIGVPSVQTVRTITHCKVINITYKVFSQAVSIFPNINNEICEVMAEKANIFENLKMEPKRKFSFGEKGKEPGANIKKRGFFNILHYIYTFFCGFSDTHANIYKRCKNSHGLEYYWAPFNALGKMSFIKYLLLPWTVNPAGNVVKIWCFFRVISALFVGIINPYRHAVRPYGAYLGFLLGALDIHAYADVYFNMHVGYFNKNGVLVTHPLKTAKHYITHSFAMDILACFPFEIFVPLFETRGTIYSVQQYFDYKCNMNLVNCILCLNRVLQIYRLASAFHISETFLLAHADLICVIKFIPMTLVFINTWVSVVVTMSCYYETQEQVFGTKFTPNTMICMNGSWLMQSHFRNITHPTDVYTVAFYWATGTLVGSGFGDVTAQHRGGMVICIWMIICGTLLFGYMFSSISSSKAGLNTTLSQYQEMLAELITFMKFENVDADLQKHFINHFEHEWKRTQGVEPHVIFSNFHTALMEDAMVWMYERTLKEVPLFEHVERSFYRVIGKHLRQNYFLRGETVIRCQDVQSNIYIIYRGKAEVLSCYNEMIACMGPGGLFGNIGSVNASICSVTVVASRNLDVLTIPSETFYALLKNYPNIKHNIDMLLTTVKDYIMPSVIVDDGDEESLTDYSRMMSSELPQVGSVSTMGTVGTGTILASVTWGIVSRMSCWCLLLPQNWFKFAILPESPIFVIFSYIVLFAAYLDCIFISYIFAFQDHSYMPIILTVCVESIFYIKIFLELHKAYIDRFGEYVVNSAKIRRRYLHHRYKIAVDVIANFPVEFLAIFAYGYEMKALSIARLLHLVRIVYIYEFYKARSNILMVNKLSLQMSSLVIWVTLLIHSMACIWFFMACPLGEVTPNSWVDNAGVDTSEPFRSYTTSIYYITGLFTTTGYGDILPYTIPEVLVITMMMVISKFSVALFIGDITAVLNSYTSTLTNYEYGMAKLRDMLKNQNLSNHQMEKMWNYVRQLWKRERGKQMPRLVLQAPFVLKCDLMNATYGHHLRHSYVFANTNEAFIRQLTVLLRHFVFFPGNYIVQHGDTDMRMYFIHCGEVDVLTVHPNLTETIHDVLKPNDMFGVAQGLYHGLPHHFSFRAKTVVDIVTLELDLWEHLLKYFPEAKDKIYQRASNIYINV